MMLIRSAYATALSAVLAVVLSAFSPLSWGATYGVTATWTDPTPAGADYSPQYAAEIRVNGGASTPINALPGPSLATQSTASQGDVIEVRVRAINVVGTTPLPGAWSAWVQAIAPVAPRTPDGQTNISITVTPQ